MNDSVKVVFLDPKKFIEFASKVGGRIMKNGKIVDISKVNAKKGEVYLIENGNNLYIVRLE